LKSEKAKTDSAHRENSKKGWGFAKMRVTQSHVAQIESFKVAFDLLLNILSVLGYSFKTLTKRKLHEQKGSSVKKN